MPNELGELVKADLSSLMDSLFPEEEVPDPLDREAAEHRAFALSRADGEMVPGARSVWVGRASYLEALDAHAAGEGPPLVLLGESGSGKSALLSNWALHWTPDSITLKISCQLTQLRLFKASTKSVRSKICVYSLG